MIAFRIFKAFDEAIENVVDGNVQRLSPVFPLQFFPIRDFAFETKFVYKFDAKFVESTVTFIFLLYYL